MRKIREEFIDSARQQIAKLSPLSMFMLRGEVGDELVVDYTRLNANLLEMAKKYGKKISVQYVLVTYGAKTENPTVAKKKVVTIVEDYLDDASE